MKTLILWARLPSYLAGFCRYLEQQPNHEVIVAGLADATPGSSAALFSDSLYRGVKTIRMDRDQIESDAFIADRIREHSPDALIISGWQFPPYRRLYGDRSFQHIPKILSCDNTWRGTVRQRLGRFVLSKLFRNAARVWVPGKRGRQLMRHWKVDPSKVIEGMYSVDPQLFSEVTPSGSNACDITRRRRLLFVGQLVERKGFDLLIEAYRRYRKSVAEPWELVVCGRGPLQHLCEGDGIDFRGFVDGAGLPQVFQQVDALVLPSLHDSWGVVLCEAAFAGKPILASEACGAVDDLLIDGVNGYRVETGNVSLLQQAMTRLHDVGVAERNRMGMRSRRLASPYSASTVAERMAGQLEAIVNEARSGQYRPSTVTAEA